MFFSLYLRTKGIYLCLAGCFNINEIFFIRDRRSHPMGHFKYGDENLPYKQEESLWDIVKVVWLLGPIADDWSYPRNRERSELFWGLFCVDHSADVSFAAAGLSEVL
ncbi:hypothetical protein AVEN_232410-1 [Araneus ventricosus]|uniref:Uncharacterized protein n=1 Tax=Araneus ventricosus TaxID=182803 RepID=A0A4Y2CV50_ARAVE|nr:hypothetical protein AVEN_232410-1 [Araneus ventricosus]